MGALSATSSTQASPWFFDGFSFTPDKVLAQPGGLVRLSNSNYVIDAKEI